MRCNRLHMESDPCNEYTHVNETDQVLDPEIAFEFQFVFSVIFFAVNITCDKGKERHECQSFPVQEDKSDYYGNNTYKIAISFVKLPVLSVYLIFFVFQCCQCVGGIYYRKPAI